MHYPVTYYCIEMLKYGLFLSQADIYFDKYYVIRIISTKILPAMFQLSLISSPFCARCSFRFSIQLLSRERLQKDPAITLLRYLSPRTDKKARSAPVTCEYLIFHTSRTAVHKGLHYGSYNTQLASSITVWGIVSPTFHCHGRNKTRMPEWV